jgi:hypothetical protein
MQSSTRAQRSLRNQRLAAARSALDVCIAPAVAGAARVGRGGSRGVTSSRTTGERLTAPSAAAFDRPTAIGAGPGGPRCGQQSGVYEPSRPRCADQAVEHRSRRSRSLAMTGAPIASGTISPERCQHVSSTTGSPECVRHGGRGAAAGASDSSCSPQTIECPRSPGRAAARRVKMTTGRVGARWRRSLVGATPGLR